MTEQKKEPEQPKLNTLIPMQDPSGNRCFVNSWDVKARKEEGWQVLGDLKYHEASTKAPVDLVLAKGEPAAPAGDSGPSPADLVAAERARVRAISKAADDKQEALADKLIADGVPIGEALKALDEDVVARKAKTKPPAAPVAPAAPAAAAPQK